jgi:hypothetical protein
VEREEEDHQYRRQGGGGPSFEALALETWSDKCPYRVLKADSVVEGHLGRLSEYQGDYHSLKAGSSWDPDRLGMAGEVQVVGRS